MKEAEIAEMMTEEDIVSSLMSQNDHYRFLETVWHFPPDGDCYETIYFGAHRITIADALRYMIAWVKKHPNAGPEEGFCPHNAMCVMEMSDDICDNSQYSARIELSYEEE